MISTRSEAKLIGVYPLLAKRWRQVALDMLSLHGRQLIAIEGLRTIAQQWINWGKGRVQTDSGAWLITDPKAVVTHAMPGLSLHHYGLAIDSGFAGADPYLEHVNKKESDFAWSEYGRICKLYGLEWGGDWKGAKIDRPHCQLTFGLNINQVRDLAAIKGNVSVWEKCDKLSLIS